MSPRKSGNLYYQGRPVDSQESGEEKACEFELERGREGNDTYYQSYPEQEGEEAQRQMCEAEYSISTETNLLF